jgi:DNA invertase Pin-like site-specific DNA recombinase
MHRDAGYARISSDDLRLGVGVGRQEEDVRKTSERTGGQLVAMFTDNDLSASKYARKKRKDYPRILDMARAGAIDRVIVYRLDRLLRIPRELEDLIDLCEQRNLLVVNLHGSMDLTTAEGRKYARDRVADAAFESDLISERVKRANDDIAARGEPLTRKRAFGYSCNGRHHPDDCRAKDCDRHCEVEGCKHDGRSIVPAEAELLRQAVADVLAGESITGIAKRWNALGVPTAQRGTRWEPTTVKVVLTGARQAGLVKHRGEIVGPGNWDAIIDRDSHDRVKRIIESRGHEQPRRRGEFTGLFRTVEGYSLMRNPGRGRVDYRFMSRPGREGHNTSIAAGPLEDLVRGWLFDRAEDGTIERRRQDRQQRRTLVPVGEDVSELERRLVELAEDEADGRITRAEWLAKRERLTGRLQAAQEAQQRHADDDAIADVTAGLRERWDLPPDEGGYSVDRKRAILHAVFERIVIHPRGPSGPRFDPNRVEPIWRE